MLKAGADATSGSNPDPRFALHTRQGVGDASAVASEANKQLNMNIIQNAIETTGKVAGEIYKGYQLADLEKQLKSEAIDPFISRLGQQPASPKDIAEQQGVIHGLGEQEAGLFQQFGQAKSQDIIDALNANESSVVREGTKLKAALQQGQMTQQEFELRLRSVTRSAINRNPGLSQELLAHAQLVESQSGIRLIPDLQNKIDQTEAKKEAAQLKIEYSQHQKFNTFIDPGRYESDPNYRALKMRQTEDKAEDKSSYDSTKQLYDLREKLDETTVKQYASTELPKIIRGGYRDFVSISSALFEDGETSASNIASKLTQLEQYRTNAVAEMRSHLMFQRVPLTDVDKHVKHYEDMLDSTIKTVKEDKSGGNIADILKNQENIMTSSQEIAVREKYDVASFGLLSKIPASMKDWMELERRNPEIIDQTVAGLQSLLQGANTPSATGILTSRTMQKNKTDAASALQIAINSDDVSSQSAILDAVKKHTIDMKDRSFSANLQDKIKAQWGVVSELGDIKHKGKLNLDAASLMDATNITRDFLADAGKSFRREVDKLNEDPNIKVVTKLSKNGQMVIEAMGAPPGVESSLNQKYAKAFNDGVKAMANIHNDSWQQSSQTLLNNIKGDWYLNGPGNPLLEVGGEVSGGKRGQNETNPGNIKVPGEDKFQKFESVQEGVGAIKKQLDLYHSGKSGAAGLGNRLITPEQMLAKYHNSQEKGSISQDQYLKNIATHSGMSVSQLQEPIEAGDRESWVDLVYGIIKSESKNNITRKDVRQALNQ